MLEAKRLLAGTNLSVAAIARKLGLSEATNFSKYFIRNTDNTPSDFRSGHLT
jgi:AraC-like DNA-binding protein